MTSQTETARQENNETDKSLKYLVPIAACVGIVGMLLMEAAEQASDGLQVFLWILVFLCFIPTLLAAGVMLDDFATRPTEPDYYIVFRGGVSEPVKHQYRAILGNAKAKSKTNWATETKYHVYADDVVIGKLSDIIRIKKWAVDNDPKFNEYNIIGPYPKSEMPPYLW